MAIGTFKARWTPVTGRSSAPKAEDRGESRGSNSRLCLGDLIGLPEDTGTQPELAGIFVEGVTRRSYSARAWAFSSSKLERTPARAICVAPGSPGALGRIHGFFHRMTQRPPVSQRFRPGKTYVRAGGGQVVAAPPRSAKNSSVIWRAHHSTPDRPARCYRTRLDKTRHRICATNSPTPAAILRSHRILSNNRGT